MSSGFFAESNGAPSSMRLLMFLVVTVVLMVWAVTCIRSGQYQPLQIGDVAVLIGVPFVKVLQKSKEKRL